MALDDATAGERVAKHESGELVTVLRFRGS